MGTITEFRVTKLIQGLETYGSFTKNCNPINFRFLCFSSILPHSLQHLSRYEPYSLTLDCDTRCSECTGTSNTECSVCVPTVTFSSPSTCDCTSSQFFSTPLSQCFPCHSSCLTCSGSLDSECLSCSSPLSLTGAGTCDCPSGYDLIGSSCECNTLSVDGDCHLCGNGELDSGEECDDLNTLDSDGCSSTCQEEPFYSCSGAGEESCKYLGSLRVGDVKF